MNNNLNNARLLPFTVIVLVKKSGHKKYLFFVLVKKSGHKKYLFFDLFFKSGHESYFLRGLLFQKKTLAIFFAKFRF